MDNGDADKAKEIVNNVLNEVKGELEGKDEGVDISFATEEVSGVCALTARTQRELQGWSQLCLMGFRL